ncbi:MAG: GNAT family N-acetyltransferase [Desulfobacterales bacterium]|nr:GNAT family N-acetyltransferase [Desulfobacterales bacterium]MDD4073461.1 GNAT family N-acetyltransferase [Desulfobacterales bacterium]MDD4392766.1 GNAT family N-acetyltransferase [Desulfobacterales bacterium]
MSVTVIEATAQNQQEWDTYCTSHCAFYAQHWFWHDTLKKLGFTPISLMARDRKNNMAGIFRAAILKMPLHRYAISTQADGRMAGGPLCSSEEASTALLRKFDGICRESHVAKAVIMAGVLGSNTPFWKESVESLGFKEQDKGKCSFVLDLEQGGSEAVFANMSRRLRNRIRKGEKKGLRIREVRRTDDVKKYFTLKVKTWNMLGNLCPRSGEFDVLSHNILTYGKMYIAEVEDKPVGGAYCYIDQNCWHLKGAVRLEQYDNYEINKAVFWRLITDAEKSGVRYIDFGSTAINSTHYTLKKSFQAQPFPLLWYEKTYHPLSIKLRNSLIHLSFKWYAPLSFKYSYALNPLTKWYEE